MDITFHYPPDLMNLLIQTIPKLCRSKKDTILFFKGAGIDQNITNPLMRRINADRNSVSKYEIAQTIISRINEKGEVTLRERREVLKRVVEFEDFSTCYPNDALVAEGLVAKVRHAINVKDSFTRMQMEEERHRIERTKKQDAEKEQKNLKQSEMENVRKDFFALFSEIDANRRGKMLEPILNRLFNISGILVSEGFTLNGENKEGIVEQVDGVIQFEGNYYLVEMKWWKDPLGVPDVSQHMVRVYHRGQSRGIFISSSGYTEPAISTCRDGLQNSVFILFELQELVLMLEKNESLADILREKIKAAVLHKNPFFRPLSDKF